MSETKAPYTHGGKEEPTRCPTCSAPVTVGSQYTDWPLVDDDDVEIGRRGGTFPTYTYTPLALTALERDVVELAITARTSRFQYERSDARVMETGAVRALIAARAAEKGEPCG